MVYNTQNYWVFGLFPLSCILENRAFRKLDLFPSSGEDEGEDKKTPTLLGPLERANLQWFRFALSKWPNWVGVFSPTFTWGRKQIQFPKRHVFWNTRRWKKFKETLLGFSSTHSKAKYKTVFVSYLLFFNLLSLIKVIWHKVYLMTMDIPDYFLNRALGSADDKN
jgi:hypothetical protein